MRYGIDLDGVLGDFGSRVVQIGNRLWPGKFPPGYIPDNWNYEGYLTEDEWDQVWANIKATPYFWLDEQAMPGVEELQDHLAFFGEHDEVFFITARQTTKGEPPLAQSSQWLRVHGLWPRNGYSVVLQVEDPKHKQDLFRGLKLNYMLDDYAPTIEQLNKIEGMHAYVLDQPWNRYATSLPRVYSVSEYLDKIRRIENLTIA